jgi:alkylation response protein AidB-like acyl-CoA dehydrogenase
MGGHSMDMSDPKAPKTVHFFVPRGTPGVTIKDTWDVMGMRATRSDDTVFESAFIPDKYIARVIPAGVAGVDMFVIGFFTWALVGFANIYYGLSLRVRELIVEQLKTKTSIALTRPMIYHPEIQHGIAEISMDLEVMGGPARRSDRERLERGPDRTGLVPAAGGDEAPDGRVRVPHRRSGARSVGRIRHVQEERARTAVPRLPRGPLPSDESDDFARAGRKDHARDQPGRVAALGIG